MLTVSGKCLSCTSQHRKGVTQSGKPYDFITHECCIHHTGSKPVDVNTGDVPLTPEKYYKMRVRVNPFLMKSGGAWFELMTYKDHPPQEITPPAAK